MLHLPPDELIQAAKQVLNEWRADYPWPVGDPDIVISLILQYLPDEWAKVNGRWVQLDKPIGHRLPYDFVEYDWGTLNDALHDGRIRTIPHGTFCICDADTTCALHARED